MLEVRTQAESSVLQLWLFLEPPENGEPPDEHRESRPCVTGKGDCSLIAARFRLGDSLRSSSFRPVVGDGQDGSRGFLIALPLAADTAESP